MTQNMFWFDDRRDVPNDEKIQWGIERYEERYHCRPIWCRIHPTEFDRTPATVDGVGVVLDSNILPFHFYFVGPEA